ncbi:hypothetical protein AMATHDRAFT_4893 [Amanita thiersii Skay4041]|uniref:Uncharacterized protein n=1 Tax=Amanita thiersii Skay4041 TaxID=703135 RepID=A0A2A9NFQ1_9AGAR|nr:hypothetical protein AMATHDRAFT_4893 [Amanita thiersii Skay4041]
MQQLIKWYLTRPMNKDPRSKGTERPSPVLQMWQICEFQQQLSVPRRMFRLSSKDGDYLALSFEGLRVTWGISDLHDGTRRVLVAKNEEPGMVVWWEYYRLKKEKEFSMMFGMEEQIAIMMGTGIIPR